MPTETAPRTRKRANRRPWIIGGAILAVLLMCAGGAYVAMSGMRSAAQRDNGDWTTVEVTTGDIDASVSATGNVEPQRQANLNFTASGTVQELLVEPGDQVANDAPLARIDAGDLQLNLEKAQAELRRAQADYQKLLAGATPAEIAQAQAQLEQAQGNYQQVAGNVTEADIAAARSRVEEARTKLDQLQAGPKTIELQQAESKVTQAQNELQSQRDSLSAAKTNAALGLERSTADLQNAQVAYATAKKNWDFVQETGANPQQPETGGVEYVTNPDGTRVPREVDVKNKVNDTQRQQYYDAYVQAETALRKAETAVTQAQVEYDNARQAEVSGVQRAEQQLADAQRDLDDVRGGAEPEELASARAALQSAQADLNKLVGGSRQGSLNQAAAGIENAQAALDKLTADPDTSDIAVAEATVASAMVGVDQAQRQLEEATLRAPYAATVAEVNIREGETTSSTGTEAAVVLADLSKLLVKVPVDELDVAQIKTGLAVRVTLDALPDAELTGEVSAIAPLATRSDQGTTTYEVTVAIAPGNTPVRPGMTAAVQIITNTRQDVVLVPRRAIQTDGGTSYVWVPTAGEPEPGSGRPASERRDVTLGLSNDEVVEVTSGLQAGDEVLVAGVVSTFQPGRRGG